MTSLQGAATSSVPTDRSSHVYSDHIDADSLSIARLANTLTEAMGDLGDLVSRNYELSPQRGTMRSIIRAGDLMARGRSASKIAEWLGLDAVSSEVDWGGNGLIKLIQFQGTSVRPLSTRRRMCSPCHSV